jgi:hypothetical protein
VAKSACLLEAHRPSASRIEPRAAQVSFPGVSSPPGSPAVSNPAVLAPSESSHGQYPGGSQALSTPRRRRKLFGLLGLISADVQSCSARRPRRSWLGSPAHPSRPRPPPVYLTYLRLPWPARGPRLTNHDCSEGSPAPDGVRFGSPGPIMRSKSAREIRPDESKMNRPYRQWAAAAAALRQRAPGLARMTVHGL